MKNTFSFAFSALLFLLALTAFGQGTRVVSTKKPAKPNPPAVAAAAKVAPVINYNLIPLFGEQPRTPAQQRGDALFLASCDQNFGSREEASKFFAERAWEYLGEGTLDTATHRFNLAYLLNPQNVEAYWGLGVVQFNKGNSKGAMALLNRGLSLDTTNAVLMTDLATLHLNHFLTDSTATPDLLRASTLLDRAATLDTTNANLYQKLAQVAYHQQQYDQAWTYFHRSRALDSRALDINFLTQLMLRREDPLGVFKTSK